MVEKLYIIDGHSQIFRAYYAPFGNLTSPSGEPTRATHVFCAMLLKFIKQRDPKFLVMAIDGPSEQLLRKGIYSDYKATRKATPDDLPVQIRRIMQIVQAAGIPILKSTGYEADDVIATVASRFASTDCQVVCISGDKDLDQLVGPNVVLYDPMKDKFSDAASILADKGFPPEKAVEVQTLTGDSIDNVPGVEGVGPKTAAKLICQYGSVQGVIEHADELPPKLREKLLAAKDQLDLARKLVTLGRDVPLEPPVADLQAMRFAGFGAKARPIFAELGFNRLLEQLDQMGVAGDNLFDAANLAQEQGHTTAADFNYNLVNTPQLLDAMVQRLAGVKRPLGASPRARLAVDTETTGLEPMQCELVGISLCGHPGEAYYIPVKGPLGAEVLDVDLVRQKLAPILEDATIEKIGQNLKFDLMVLWRAGFKVCGPMFDTMVAAHVLDSSRMTYKLDALCAEFLGHRCIPIADLIGRGKNATTMNMVPLDRIAIYASEDADTTFRLFTFQEQALKIEGLYDLFINLEMPLMPVLADMEKRGIKVDRAQLRQMQGVLSAAADKLRDQIVQVAGYPFNPDSPKQLADVLFGKLALPPKRKTKTGPSTDSDVLEELALLHELPALVLDYRKLMKLVGTYCVGLGDCINPRTGRIHTSFHQAGTATGRLSSSDPNLQNIPIRSEEGRQIRSAFVADDGCLLLSADYSQVELRVLAHFCQDPILMKAFEDNQDIHRIVAAQVFNVPADQVTPEQRGRAKTVNFGIIYGQTAFGLAATLRISRTDAGQFIAAYRARFARVEEFLQACIDAARKQGYVETIFGRRRLIPDIDAANPSKRNAAERLAINSVVQGSAADLIKQAMVNIDRRITTERRPSKMLLQIHDELLFETPQAALESDRQMIVHEMENAIKQTPDGTPIKLRVPLKVDTGAGKNWKDAK